MTACRSQRRPVQAVGCALRRYDEAANRVA